MIYRFEDILPREKLIPRATNKKYDIYGDIQSDILCWIIIKLWYRDKVEQLKLWNRYVMLNADQQRKTKFQNYNRDVASIPILWCKFQNFDKPFLQPHYYSI